MMPERQQACSSVLASKPMFSYKKKKKITRAASITEEGKKDHNARRQGGPSKMMRLYEKSKGTNLSNWPKVGQFEASH